MNMIKLLTMHRQYVYRSSILFQLAHKYIAFVREIGPSDAYMRQ